MHDPSQPHQPQPSGWPSEAEHQAVGGPAGRPYYPGPQPWQAPPPPARWTVPPPPGARYDHLARTPVHRWWRPLAGTAVIAVAFVGVSLVVLLAGVIVAGLAGVPVVMEVGRLFADPVFELAVMLLSIAAVLPFVFLTAWLVQRRPPGTLSSVAGRLRWGWLFLCTGVALVALILGQLAMTATYAATGADMGDLFGWVGWDRFLPGLIVIVLLVPFQAATEEYVFRGWVIQAFGAYFRTPWPGILFGAAVFTSLHAYTDWGIVDVFSFGVLMGWLAVRTGGLEAPIALHVINNVVSFLPAAASGDLGDALRQGAVPWQAISGTVVQLGFFAVVVVIIAQKRAIQTVSR
ncbi:CPBP family intramembrane metalloprotease [Sphaerisporangium album]|uniref:CPBP family intramembrane metalloprotease n=1 Tax=Sphaerisporangium album TaxID=509200 RepID=A0A367EL24_9ACTN|nr:type II CAAX endopeptidase family protein [Sphaerisporangium album]RCG18663.1 CPBP family intramembrane metalloprotease [Sphaerisporangium album]